MSLFNETLPHLVGPAYVSLMLLQHFIFLTKIRIRQKWPKGFAVALGLYFC